MVLTPGVALQAGIKGYIHGNAQASVFQDASFTAKLGYINGEFDATSESRSFFDYDPPTYQAQASARAWAGPRLEVLLYGAVGPFARAEAFIEASASVEGPPPCVLGVLDAGLSATVGIDFLADYETTLFDERKQLAQFNSCSTDPNAPGGERPTITWARSYGRDGSGGEQAKAVLQATDGTYLVVGESSLFNGVTGFAASTWALRLDALGNVMWQKAFGRTQQGLTRGAVQVPRGFLIAGTSGVIKLDTGGNPVWARAYTSDPLLEIASIAAHPDGSFVLAGFHGTTAQAWAMKLDPRGNVLWSRRYAGNEFARIRVTSGGGYIALGGETGWRLRRGR